MNMIIKNQCTDIELASPVHFIKNATRHIPFPQQVNSKSEMKVNFKTGIYRNTFGGVLLYHLQRKKSDVFDDRPNIDKDTSISTQLLVIWEFRIDRFYSHA
jgi:hypothetical protein